MKPRILLPVFHLTVKRNIRNSSSQSSRLNRVMPDVLIGKIPSTATPLQKHAMYLPFTERRISSATTFQNTAKFFHALVNSRKVGYSVSLVVLLLTIYVVARHAQTTTSLRYYLPVDDRDEREDGDTLRRHQLEQLYHPENANYRYYCHCSKHCRTHAISR